MKRSIESGFVSIIGAKIFILVVGTLTTPILYRLLGPTRFGTYSFVLSIFMLFMIFVSSGVGDGVRKFLAEERHVPDWEEHVVGFYFRLAIGLAALGAGLLALAAEFGLVARFFGAEFTEYFYLLAVLVIAAQFREYVRRSLMGFGLERYSEPLQILNKVSFIGLALTLVYLGYGVKGMLVSHIVGSLLVVLVGFVPLGRRVSLRGIVRRTPTGFPRREMLSFNSLSILLVFLLMSLYHVDIIMLQPFRGSTQVGHYKAALKLAEFLWFVPIAVQTVFVHSTSALWSSGKHEQISELATRATRYTFLLTALMALGLFSLADIAVPVYFGAEATPAVAPLILLLPGALGLAVARPILAIAQGKGELTFPIYATGAAAVINLVLNLLLIPRYGMNGAAVATSVGYGSMFFFHLWSARQVGFNPLSDARLLRISLTTAIAAVPIFYLSRTITSDVLALVVVPPAGFVVYMLAAIATGAIHGTEVFDVLSSFPAPIGPIAKGIDRRLEMFRHGGGPERLLQKSLIAVGIVLFVSGIGLGVIGPGMAPTDEDTDIQFPTNGTEIDTPTAEIETAQLTTEAPTTAPEGETTEPTSTPTETTEETTSPEPNPEPSNPGPAWDTETTEETTTRTTEPPRETTTETTETTTQMQPTTEPPTTNETTTEPPTNGTETTEATTTETTTSPTSTETETDTETTEATTTTERTTTEATPEQTSTPTTTETTTEETPTPTPTETATETTEDDPLINVSSASMWPSVSEIRILGAEVLA